MAITTPLRRYAGRKLTHRLIRTMPWIGGLLALATLGSAVRRKGFLGGTLDTALDFIPFVGGAKNLAEMGRGRDFFPDKLISRRPAATVTSTSTSAPSHPGKMHLA